VFWSCQEGTLVPQGVRKAGDVRYRAIVLETLLTGVKWLFIGVKKGRFQRFVHGFEGQVGVFYEYSLLIY
jgi:3-methyladenine DNA glycosylase Tag